MAQHRARQFAVFVAGCKTFLAERGIPIDAESDDEDVFRRLLGELQYRGWSWNYSSAGSGYEIHQDENMAAFPRIRFTLKPKHAPTPPPLFLLGRSKLTMNMPERRPVLAPYEPEPAWLRSLSSSSTNQPSRSRWASNA